MSPCTGTDCPECNRKLLDLCAKKDIQNKHCINCSKGADAERWEVNILVRVDAVSILSQDMNGKFHPLWSTLWEYVAIFFLPAHSAPISSIQFIHIILFLRHTPIAFLSRFYSKTLLYMHGHFRAQNNGTRPKRVTWCFLPQFALKVEISIFTIDFTTVRESAICKKVSL